MAATTPPLTGALPRGRRAALASRAVDLLFVLPLLLLLATFFVYPVLSGLLLSLRRTNGMTPGDFVGLDNYAEALLRDAVFRQALGNVVSFTAAAIVLQTGLGLLLAVLIAELRRGRVLYRLVFFAPVVVSMVAVAVVWKWIYAPYFGLLTNLLAAAGLTTPESSLLASQGTALGAIMGAFLWRWAGFNTVIYLAGLQSIPTDLYEAARIDGANGWQRFRFVTWPLLLPQTYTCVLLTTMGTLRIFDLMWIMTEGGPNHATETAATYVYVTAFRFFRVGYGAALAFVLFALVLVVTLVEVRVLRRRAERLTE
ncbi:MAG TPA: sugar ABC transporter permease [Chloroflexota bacterium]